MRFKTLLLATSLSFTGFIASAAEITSNVEKLYVNQYGVVLFKLNTTSPAECVNSNFPFGFNVNDTSGKEWFEMLHQAKLNEKEITIGFSENSPARCNVGYVYYKN